MKTHSTQSQFRFKRILSTTLTVASVTLLSVSSLHTQASMLVHESTLGTAIAPLKHPETTPQTRLEQRDTYLAARKALREKRIREFRRLKNQLDGYPLQDYLDYYALIDNFNGYSPEYVRSFITKHQGTALGEKIYYRWLHHTAKHKMWSDFLHSYSPEMSSEKLSCHKMRALINTGRTNEAYVQIPPLWISEKSRPKACDPAFKHWIAAGELTPDMVWARYELAIQKNSRSLISYLRRIMPDSLRAEANLLYSVHRKPQTLAKHHLFKGTSDKLTTIISHGLKRLARKDAEAAHKQWNHYQARHLFNDEQQFDVQKSILMGLARQDHNQLLKQMLASNSSFTSQKLVEWEIRDALQQESWPEVYRWLLKLSVEERQKTKWRYWYARTIEALTPDNAPALQPFQVYKSLAQERSFYGFLAADKVGQEYNLSHEPVDPNNTLIRQLSQLPELVRAKELFLLNQRRDAHREWTYAAEQLNNEELAAAGKMAKNWGWHFKAIESLSNAEFWNDLQVRFPVAYSDSFHKAATKTNVDSSFLMAIARQESAFLHDARSSAGALGLMQLMPGTAKDTARKLGLRYRRADLLSPDSNIRLGSTYFTQLLTRFNGNRILATAAYNAGPHRVNSWLQQQSQQVPFDIWIETIPFSETRKYVQRVLSYAVIYSHRLGKPANLISKLEASQRL